MSGDVYRHDQLNDATHDIIHEMFGIGNMTGFKHLTRLIREERDVDAKGNDVYMRNVKEWGQTRIALLQGAENGIFEPEGSKRTYEWLCQANGPELYSRHVIEKYGHMDLFIGRDAARDVFPTILDALDRDNRSRPGVPPAAAAKVGDGSR